MTDDWKASMKKHTQILGVVLVPSDKMVSESEERQQLTMQR